MENTDELGQALLSTYDSLTDEQKAAVKECKSNEELLEFAGKEGIELPEEVLDAVAGGYIYWSRDSNGEDFLEVINDKTGSVMTRIDGYKPDEAKQKATELGQSTKAIQWRDISKLRYPTMGNQC